jgi:hypothetical protein
VQQINAKPCELADRLWVKDELDPQEEALRFRRTVTSSSTTNASCARTGGGPSMWAHQ